MNSIRDPLDDDDLERIRDNRRPVGWYPLGPCRGCGVAPVWVGVGSEAGYVQDHMASCPWLQRPAT